MLCYCFGTSELVQFEARRPEQRGAECNSLDWLEWNGMFLRLAQISVSLPWFRCV